MPLFIDRLPLYSWVAQSGHRLIRHWSVSLPVLATAPRPAVPSLEGVRPQRWALDTAFTGEAYAWRTHLLEAGLDPAGQLAGFSSSRPAFGTEERLPVRRAVLWLVSNLPALRDAPFLLPLTPGIVFRDAPAPEGESYRPLLGLRVLLRAGLKVQIDFARATLSLWTPGPWHQGFLLFGRRLLSGFARRPPGW